MTDKNANDSYQYPEEDSWTDDGGVSTTSDKSPEDSGDMTDESRVDVDVNTEESSDVQDVPTEFFPKLKYHCRSLLHRFVNCIDAELMNKIFKSRFGRLGIIFIVVLVLGSLLHSCGGHHHALSNTGASSKSQAPSSTVADMRVQSGSARATASLSSEPSVPYVSSSSLEDHNQVHALNKTVDTVKQQMSAMSGAQALEAAHVSELNNKMQHMINLMAAQQAAQAKSNAEKRKAVIKQQSKKTHVALPVYHYVLQAIVPGRAWVMDSHHVMHTVAVGDKLPDYGEVQFLDADHGNVITSSGKVINFSRDVG